VEQLTTLGTSTTPEWYYADFQGNTRVLMDARGSPQVTYNYPAWGATTDWVGTGNGTPLQYNATFTDQWTGLVYDQARWYDPSTGQFVSQDPMVDQTLQPYAYAADSPGVNADATGLMPYGRGSGLREDISEHCLPKAMVNVGTDPSCDKFNLRHKGYCEDDIGNFPSGNHNNVGSYTETHFYMYCTRRVRRFKDTYHAWECKSKCGDGHDPDDPGFCRKCWKEAPMFFGTAYHTHANINLRVEGTRWHAVDVWYPGPRSSFPPSGYGVKAKFQWTIRLRVTPVHGVCTSDELRAPLEANGPTPVTELPLEHPEEPMEPDPPDATGNCR